MVLVRSAIEQPSAAPMASVSQALDPLIRWALASSSRGSSGFDEPSTSSTLSLSTAQRLKQALVPQISQPQLLLKEGAWGALCLGGAVASIASQALSPTGPGTCDHSPLERCCNCVSSLPYALVGLQTLRARESPEGKLWGASLLAVSGASLTFHSSRGKWRKWARRLDYWTIAFSSNLMLRAVYPNIPAAVTVASSCIIPFKPFFVSTATTTAMEIKFMKRAYENKELRPAHRLHALSCLAGLGCFALEDVAKQVPLMHTAWHLLSCAATATVNHLVHDVEQQGAGRSSTQQQQPQARRPVRSANSQPWGTSRKSCEPMHVVPLSLAA